MGAQYRQHAPYATDGHAGLAEWVRKFKESCPQHRYEVKKIIAEGDLVMLHLHGMSGLHPFGESVVDIFRVENGKVVEHWMSFNPSLKAPITPIRCFRHDPLQAARRAT